jgi:3-oxosteroid 1-dehydrogenase
MKEIPREVDVLVFGSGAGALSAAVVAAKEGLDVLVCEKTDKIGGTTATSGGTIWAPAANPIERAGGTATLEQARAYLKSELGDSYNAELVEAYVGTAATAVNYLEQHTEVRFEHIFNPDYHADAPYGSTSGHSMTATPFDARKLGRNEFARLRPPRDIYMILSGMMIGRRDVPVLVRPFASWKSFQRASRLVLRHLANRLLYPRGTYLLLGNALVARFQMSLLKSGTQITVNTRLVELCQEEGRIVGAIVESAGKRQFIRARHGVVLATGGFPHNPELRREFGPSHPYDHSMAAEANTGDGITAARRIGAAVSTDGRNPAFWSPGSMRVHADGKPVLWIHGHMDRGKPGFLAVDTSGRRFVNEAQSYHDVVVEMYKAPNGCPAVPTWFVVDNTFIRQFGLGLVAPRFARLAPYIKDGYLIKADSTEELAKKIDVDADNLSATVEKYNEDARSGVDQLFGRGDYVLNRFNGEPDCTPNPCMRELKPPFYAVRSFPVSIGTTVGLVTDRDAGVLDEAGSLIKGLYACGNDMASVLQGQYPAPGVTIGPAIVFGYRAAQRIAFDARRSA